MWASHPWQVEGAVAKHGHCFVAINQKQALLTGFLLQVKDSVLVSDGPVFESAFTTCGFGAVGTLVSFSAPSLL